MTLKLICVNYSEKQLRLQDKSALSSNIGRDKGVASVSNIGCDQFKGDLKTVRGHPFVWSEKPQNFCGPTVEAHNDKGRVSSIFLTRDCVLQGPLDSVPVRKPAWLKNVRHVPWASDFDGPFHLLIVSEVAVWASRAMNGDVGFAR